MTAWIVIGCIALFLLLLLSLKATVTVGYGDTVTLSVRVLFIRIRLLPKAEKRARRSMSAAQARRIRKKAEKKAAKKAEAAKKKKEKKSAHKLSREEKPKKTPREILDILSLVRAIVAAVVRKFFKHLRIDVARLKIKVATGDAASTAVAYGAITGAVSALLPVLEKVKSFKLPDQKDLSVEADFLGDGCEFDLSLSFSLRVWHVLDVALGALAAFLRSQFKKMTR